MAARQFLVERLFPILARADAGLGVEINKNFFVTEPLKRTRDIVGQRLIAARMTDKNRGHNPPSSPPSADPLDVE